MNFLLGIQFVTCAIPQCVSTIIMRCFSIKHVKLTVIQSEILSLFHFHSVILISLCLTLWNQLTSGVWQTGSNLFLSHFKICSSLFCRHCSASAEGSMSSNSPCVAFALSVIWHFTPVIMLSLKSSVWACHAAGGCICCFSLEVALCSNFCAEHHSHLILAPWVDALFIWFLKGWVVDGCFTSWSVDYLMRRLHFVRLGNCVSVSVMSSTGAPQEAVLTPFLLAVYMTDTVLPHSEILRWKSYYGLYQEQAGSRADVNW